MSIGQTGGDAPPVIGQDVRAFAPQTPVRIDAKSAIFPIESLSKLPSGEYYAQAAFHFNRDINIPNAPGDLFSAPKRVTINSNRAETVNLVLSRALPVERLPIATDFCRFVRIRSELLSRFHGRPIYLRAGVIVPRDFNTEKESKYPLWVEIGGFGSRYTGVLGEMRPGSELRKLWTSDSSPRLVKMLLDGAGSFGDPYQVNSANNGPYGDAVTQELIPFVEKEFRCIGKPYARFLSGGSTGGWVSLALQVFYPAFFNGCWSISPDPVDFRATQLVDIYSEQNAFVMEKGTERPSKRRLSGEVEYTMRNDIQRENVMGRGDSFTMSGDQWGAWNATYSPRGKDGLPAAIWDPKTGRIDLSVAEHWKKYDLRLYLQENWKRLAPLLRGKIHISVGEMDDYYLNHAVHLLDAFLKTVEPPYGGEIHFKAGRGHVWSAWSDQVLMREMQLRVEKGAAS